ncbi:hypothetical protein BGZ99_003469 [Dissophora globulifera]|uniref:Zinc metalloprotease n=1 Tax=Dissophora globulifera TaxID=979702 RepID=A0A9P6RXE4_9FUNG|nr:hypothetical protein BGZ99_003469 [Dissophora globulifera]
MRTSTTSRRCRVAAAAALCLVSLYLSVIGPVQAHSTPWPTITRSEHIRGLRHDILPKSYTDPAPLSKRSSSSSSSTSSVTVVSRHDMVRIQFTAFNTTFHLHLEPNLDLIHPEADLGDDINIEDIKAFKGVVVQDAHHSDRKWDRAARTTRAESSPRSVDYMLHEEGVLGWARMMIEHSPDNEQEMLLRGAFMTNGETYHVNTLEHYHIQKRSDDALPITESSRSLASTLVIYRDSDVYDRLSSLRRKRGLASEETSSCGAGLLPQHGSDNSASTSPLVHEYYYPPNLTTSMPVSDAMGLGSSWANLWSAGSLGKREIAVKVAGPTPVPDGCPANRLVNYMGVAADCTYVREYKGAAGARLQIFADFNTVSGIYESTFNVALGVIALNIVADGCPTTPVKGEEWNQDCSTTYPIDQRLSDFSFWRGQAARSSDGAGLWHLMTKCNSGAVVGIAWTKALCQTKSQSQTTAGQQQYTAGTGVSSISPNEWMVIAHEVGHGFGAIHDCNQQTCPGTGDSCCPLSATVCDAGAMYIMNPSESTPTKVFSPCSIKAICGTIKSSSGQCLKPPGTRTTQNSEANICGNGLKETGEECDCGSADDCAKDPCCDGTTCKLKTGAVCDDLNDDCCLNCQLRPAGQVCRKAISECDIQEVCSGTSPTCPTDVRVPNQTPCTGTANVTGLQCANGICTSRDLQCQQQDRAGVTKQCSSSTSCDLTCNDPSGAAMTCSQIPGVFFADGSPCGIGGTCNAGSCDSGGVNGVLDWAKKHLTIVIPVAVVLGLIILCCIWNCCCAGCIHRRREQRKNGKPQRLGSTGYQYQYTAIAPPAGAPMPLGGQEPYPPQQYQMGPLAPLPPAYQSSQGQPHFAAAGYTQHPNNSNDSGNPFGNHNAQSQQQQRPLPSGYI